jgi:hypothetical protein
MQSAIAAAAAAAKASLVHLAFIFLHPPSGRIRRSVAHFATFLYYIIFFGLLGKIFTHFPLFLHEFSVFVLLCKIFRRGLHFF